MSGDTPAALRTSSANSFLRNPTALPLRTGRAFSISIMAKLRLNDLALQGKRVLTRVDFNVPLDGARITDDTRIRAALPTINKIVASGGKAILMSHLGRPKGAPDEKYSLRPVAEYLQTLIDAPVTFSPDTIGEATQKIIADAPFGSVILLENTRFLPGETKNDPELSGELAKLGDVYVNDAFGAAHRAHASTVGVTEFVKQSAMGYLLQAEVETLSKILSDPQRPFVAVVGGAKVSDKLGVIKALLEKADRLLIGGAMAYTFLKGLGHDVGDSLVEEDLLDEAFRLRDGSPGVILLPRDHIVADTFDIDSPKRTIAGSFKQGMGLDIGPETRTIFRNVILDARTVLWNGPMGVFEMPNFADGTLAVAEALAETTTKNKAETVIGGGDSVAAVTQAGLHEQVTHVSTGGGAMLEFIEGQELPGIAALTDR